MGELVLFFITGFILILTVLFLFLLIRPDYYPFKQQKEIVSRWKILGTNCVVWLIYLILIVALTPDDIATTSTNPPENDPAMWTFLGGFILGCILFYWVIQTGKPQLRRVTKSKQYHEEIESVKPILVEQPKKEEITSKPAPVEGNYLIVYEKEDGERSTRFIDIQQIYTKHKRWYIDAYCYQTFGKRTFRADRILELHNKKTGDFITNQTAIRAYIRELGKTGVF